MIDYGLMALVLIQLSAVIGCLLAWFRIRTEIDRIKDRAVTEPFLTSTLENRLSPFMVRMNDVEAGLTQCELVASKSVSDAGKALQASKEMEDFERKLTSIQNALSALKRHREPKPEPETVSEFETIPENGHIENLPSPPTLRGRNMHTFGKTA